MRHNKLWPPWHPLQSIWCQMMTDVLSVVRQATLVATALMHRAITAKSLATSPKTVLTKSLLWEHISFITGHVPKQVMTTTVGTDHSPLTVDAAKEDALTSQDHTTDPTMAEALATIDTDKSHLPSNHFSSSCYPSTDQSPRWHSHQDIPHWHNCDSSKTCHFPSRVTLGVIPQTEADLVQDTLTILAEGWTKGKHQNCTHKQQPLINYTARRGLPFRIHNWTPQSMTPIL